MTQNYLHQPTLISDLDALLLNADSIQGRDYKRGYLCAVGELRSLLVNKKPDMIFYPVEADSKLNSIAPDKYKWFGYTVWIKNRLCRIDIGKRTETEIEEFKEFYGDEAYTYYEFENEKEFEKWRNKK